MASLVPPEFAPSDFCCDYSSPLSSDYLADYLENETQVLDELLHVQGFPTPPTSPERVYTPAEDEDSESDSSQDLPMLNELILLAYGEEVLSDSPLFSCDRNLQDKLIQDCMWSGHLCDKEFSKTTTTAPLNLPPTGSTDSTTYSPATSPPPPPVPAECDTPPEEEIAPMQTDCISPSAVFPTLLPPTSTAAPNSNGAANIAEVKKSLRMAERFHKGVEPVRRRLERERYEKRLVTMAMTGGNGRVQPQAESSTSDEEIDVVTIPAMERNKMSSRKRTLPLSPPSSRQSSPHPVTSSPPKRKKYHTKRLSSAGSCGDGIESDDEARRASHNVLERKRRNDLKSSFQKLREEIPELEDNQRAPKVTILRKAMDYIQHMQELERAAERELQMERRRKARLLERLSQLRSCHV